MADSDMLVGYLLRTVRVVVWITALVLGALAVSLSLPGGERDVDATAALLAAAVVLTAVGVALSRVARKVSAHVDLAGKSRRESEHRAELLATVARTARSLSALESTEVLKAVVQGATTLGLESANLAMFDEIEGTYRVAHGIGLPQEYVEGVHSATAGMLGLVRSTRETVLVDDYANHPNAIPSLKRHGFRSAMATPVWVHGRLTAALVGGTRDRSEVSPEEVEAFELLAALAGRALENVRAFEDERRTVERMAELDRMKGNFLSNVSHELRTPLTAISGMGLTLEQQWDGLDDEVRRELLARLNANARTLDRIIGNLLDYSRLEAGRMDIRMEPVRVDELLEQVVGRLRTLFGTHPLAVKAERGLLVNGDPLLLDRVVENLLSNAVKHTPAGTTVTLQARREAGQVTVAVADDGPGIPPEEQRRLGDRFFRGRDSTARRTRGTGLGLALVREILRLHDSELEVESIVGRGTRFGFRLPPATNAGGGSAPSTATASA
jgi:signal transduction histidine kinase